MARENGRRAIELLAQHDAHQLVRPGRRAERQHQIGLVANRLVVPVGAANGDHERLATAVAQLADTGGEII